MIAGLDIKTSPALYRIFLKHFQIVFMFLTCLSQSQKINTVRHSTYFKLPNKIKDQFKIQ